MYLQLPFPSCHCIYHWYTTLSRLSFLISTQVAGNFRWQQRDTGTSVHAWTLLSEGECQITLVACGLEAKLQSYAFSS
ncbi:hypothetical protein BS78_02G034500 [Paspalum vaginatum]|nr:hypothetical protein BS78_02G034500 [Paspalum vaginatum]